MKSKKTLMIAGHASLPQGMAAKGLFGTLAVVAEADTTYGVIVDAACTLVTKEAQEFIASILVGHSLKDGIDSIIEEIKTRYHGAAQNALVAALKDLYRTYNTLQDKKCLS